MADKNAVWKGIEDDFDPNGKFGFVYAIKNLEDSHWYIGSKRFWAKSGGVYKESNWKKYQSSSDKVKKWDNVEKRILKICYGKFELEYEEISALIKTDALLRRDCENWMLGRFLLGRPTNAMMK